MQLDSKTTPRFRSQIRTTQEKRRAQIMKPPKIQTHSRPVFLTQLLNAEDDPLIPDKLPIKSSTQNVKRISLPSKLQEYSPSFMLGR